MMNWLKVNAIDNGKLIKNIKYIEDEMPNITNLATTVALNAKLMRLKVRYLVSPALLLLLFLMMLKIRYQMLVLSSKRLTITQNW